MLKNRKANKINCESCFVNQLCIARGINPDELNEINNIISNILVLKKGEHAYFSEDPMTSIYSVYQGSCKQYLQNEDGVERVENFYFPGDLIGLESIPNGKYRYSLMALEDTMLCIIPVPDLISQMQKSADFTRRVLVICSYKMQNDKQIANTTNASQRIADILLNIFYRLDERKLNKTPITLSMSQVDISNFLGMTHETVNRSLRKLHKEKIITIQNKTININDIERLKLLGTYVYTQGQNHE